LRSSVNGDVARSASSPSVHVHVSALADEFGLSSGEVVRALQDFREKKREREQKEREEKERFAENVKFLSIVDAVVDRLRPLLSSVPASSSSSLAPSSTSSSFAFGSSAGLSLVSTPSLPSFAFGPDQPPPLSPGSAGGLPASAISSVAASSATEVKVKSEEKGKETEDKEKSKRAERKSVKQQERDKELLAIAERELATIVADLEKKFPDSDALSKQFKDRGLSYKKGTKRGEALQLLAEAILKTR